MVTKAKIKAKVLAVRPDCTHDWRLIVLIKRIDYTWRDINGDKNGKVTFAHFHHKAIFDIVPCNSGEIKQKISTLVYGDVINFSVIKDGGIYRFLSLEVENEQPCANNCLDSIVEQYGYND